MEKGSKLILAPKSNSALLMLVCPIVQAMVGQLGSLYLTGMGSDNGSLMLIARKTFFGTLIFCYLVLKNLAYNGTC